MKHLLAKLNSPARQSPFPRWVIPHKLALGSHPQPGDAIALHAAGIQLVFSLCSEQEAQLPIDICQQFKCDRLVLPDSHYATALQVDQLAAAVQHIQTAMQRQQSIYVHCLAGIERSPTVCIAYLCLTEGVELWEALNWVKQINPRTSLTFNQTQTIQKLIRDY